MDKNKKHIRDAMDAFMRDVRNDPEYQPPEPGATRASIQDQALREYADRLSPPRKRRAPRWVPAVVSRLSPSHLREILTL